MIKFKNLILTNGRDMKEIQEFAELTYIAGQKINANAIQMLYEGKYTKFEIMNYLKNYLGYEKNEIYHGEAEYIVKMPRGHVQILNDDFYNNTYLHQLVIARALDISVEELKDRNYVIHHVDTIKDNNDLSNLYIFIDKASHIAFHMLLKKDDNADIREFNRNYITSLMKKGDEQEKLRINKYLTDLDKLEQIQVNKKNA